MRARIKLMASLRNKLPPGSLGGVAQVELDTPATVASLLQRLGLSSGQVHLVLVNGEMTHNREHVLAEGDELTIFPPVAGGVADD